MLCIWIVKYDFNMIEMEMINVHYRAKKKTAEAVFYRYSLLFYQYIPPIEGSIGAAGAGGSGLSATTLSVVSTIEATDAAF